MSSVEFRVDRSSVTVLTRALEQVAADLENEGRAELRALGTMVERDIGTRAAVRIIPIGKDPVTGTPWSAMRAVAKPNVVYVAPMNKGTHGRGPRRRNEFDDVLWERAMYPSMRRHEREVYRRFQALADRVCGRFNRA